MVNRTGPGTSRPPLLLLYFWDNLFGFVCISLYPCSAIVYIHDKSETVGRTGCDSTCRSTGCDLICGKTGGDLICGSTGCDSICGSTGCDSKSGSTGYSRQVVNRKEEEKYLLQNLLNTKHIY